MSQVVQSTRAVFRSGRTLPTEWRIEQLKAMLRLLEEQDEALTAAMQQDLNKVMAAFMFYSGLVYYLRV